MDRRLQLFIAGLQASIVLLSYEPGAQTSKRVVIQPCAGNAQQTSSSLHHPEPHQHCLIATAANRSRCDIVSVSAKQIRYIWVCTHCRCCRNYG